MTLIEIGKVKKALGDRIRSSKIVRYCDAGHPSWALKATMFDGVEKTFYSPADLDAYFQIYF